MDLDLIFVLGLIVGAFSIPSFVNAYSDNRPFRTPALMLLVAAAMIYYPIYENPSAYSIATVDNVILEVIGRYVN